MKMSPIILKIRTLMVRMGDLPDVESDASMGLSNGAILKRLQEIERPQSADTNNQPTSEGEGG